MTGRPLRDRLWHATLVALYVLGAAVIVWGALFFNAGCERAPGDCIDTMRPECVP